MVDPSDGVFRILDLTAANPPSREDPYPRLSELRSRCPIHRDEAGGAHICPGAPLARMETKHLLSRLFIRFPKLRLADETAPLHWRRLRGFRGLERLDVRID